MKKLALFDIDGTILPGSLGLFAIADLLKGTGLFNPKNVAEMYEIRVKYHARQIAYEYFSGQLMMQTSQGLKGQDYLQIISLVNKHLESISDKFYPYVQNLVRDLLPNYDIYFITANSQYYAEFFTKFYKAAGYKATILEVKNGKFTGHISESLIQAKHKKRAIENLINFYGKAGSIAFGDAEADRLMLSEVEFPICINPTAGLREIALRNGWTITDHLNAEKTVRILLKP